ncbi:MAG: glycosyltransferase family 2 protein, partial [Cyanobacteria bacterium J06626_26]
IEKHNRYSSDEAAETIRQLADHGVNWHALLLGSSEVERRRALKDLSLRLPLRPLVRFVYMYVFLGGLLDGRAGFTWCLLQAFYEYLITLKVWELQHGCTTDITRVNTETANKDLTPKDFAKSL